MCRGCGLRHNSVVIDGIPAQVQNVNRTAQLSTLPIELGPQSPAKFEPIRGFALKETEEQMGMLKKENFSLKLRIYFLEEQMGKKKFSPESNADIYNALELKAEAEALKDELASKEELLSQASEALSELEQQFQKQVDEITNNNEREKYQLKGQIQELQNEVDEFWSVSTQDERSSSVEPELQNLCHSDSIGGLSDLCDLAFNTTSDESIENAATFAHMGHMNTQENDTTVSLFNSSASAPLQGLFSIVNDLDNEHHSTLIQQDMAQQNPKLEQNLLKKDESQSATVRVMERQVAMLETQVMELEEELAGKEDRSFILEGDLENLRKELEDKTEEVVTLQVEILDKDMKIENISNELQSCNKNIEDKELQIQKLCEDLHNVEPEMEVTVQRIIERDRIIEGKIEQIETQNKIIVEIQITLDEKQKQIGELEENLIHAEQELSSVTHQLDNETRKNESVLAELQDKEHVVAQLKRNLKKQEHNVHKLGAELKESVEQLNKIQWEAQNCTSDDSVSDMAQEENEHLWAEMEQTRIEMAKLQSDHDQTMANAQNTINELQKNLQDQYNELCSIKEKHKKQIKECEDSLQHKAKELIHLESTVLQLTNDIATRNQELQNNINQITYLKEQLSEAKEKLCASRCETDKLKNEIKFNNNSNSVTDYIDPVVNQEHINVNNYADYHSIQSNDIDRVNYTTNKNEIKGKPSLIDNESNNTNLIRSEAASLEWENIFVNSNPVSITATNNDSQLLAVLCNEISDIRKDTQALRCERKVLSEKVVDLQNLVKQQLPVYNELKNIKSEKEDRIEISDENKEKLNEIALSTNSQLAKLNKELDKVKNRINCQFKEVHIHSNQEIIANYEEENVSLRKQLTATSEKCELLTSNLEEMSTCLYKFVSSEEENKKCNTMPIKNIEDNKTYTNIEVNLDDDQYIENFNDENINNKTIPYINTTIELESLEENHAYSESTVSNHSINNFQQNQYVSDIEEDDNMDILEENDLNCSNDSEISINTSDFIVLTPLLQNINSLCQKLEAATTKNDILKEQLQNAMKSQYSNNYLNYEVIPEYQATVEELSETIRQLEESQALLSETTQQSDILQQQHLVNLSHTEALEVELHNMYKSMDEKDAILEEKEMLLQAAKQMLEDREAHTEAMVAEMNEMYKSIDEKNIVLEEKEFSLLAAKQLLKEKEILLQETSIQVNTTNEVIQGLSDEIEYLQKVACEKSSLEDQVNELQCSLQFCESRLLQVNKERLAQVTESKHQQAQIAAFSLQIQALEDEQSITKEIIAKNDVLKRQLEEEKATVLILIHKNENLMESKHILEEERARGKQTLEENSVLIKQLENERETMSLIQQEKKDLMSEKLNLQKDLQQIQNELTTIDSCVYNIQAQHNHDVQQYHIQHHNYQILREKHIKLQQNHSELQMKAEQLEDDLLCQIKAQKQLETDQQQMKNLETHIKQLTTQVETERQLTSNLRQQLETIRSENANSTSHDADKTSQRSEENSLSEISPSEPPNENNQKASCLSQKGTKNKKRKVHWSDQPNCQQNEENDSCAENKASTAERNTKSIRRMKNDSEPETGTIPKLSLHDIDMKEASEISFSTISSCSFSVQKKNKRSQIPVFISNGQYG